MDRNPKKKNERMDSVTDVLRNMGIEEKHMYIQKRKNYFPAWMATLDEKS
jgi:hypothetical protein